MADVSIELEFKPEGFQQVLNSGGTKALLDTHASGVVARMGGFPCYKRAFTATMFGFGPRPAVAVHTRAKTAKQAAAARKRLEGAM